VPPLFGTKNRSDRVSVKKKKVELRRPRRPPPHSGNSNMSRSQSPNSANRYLELTNRGPNSTKRDRATSARFKVMLQHDVPPYI